jgi:ERCC4-type nuclease
MIMDVFEQKEVLKSFEILIDTREQDTKRARRRYETFGVPYRRGTLSYGDYTYNAILPDGKPILDPDKTAEPLCSIERKMNLDELAQCFTRGRKRFKNEFERAMANGCRITLIVENASWENLYNGKYRTKFNSNAFVASVHAWANRYGMNLIFCKEETSGKIIKDILYRDLKERLERGEFG